MKLAAAAAQAQRGLKDSKLIFLEAETAAPAKLLALVARLLFTAQAVAVVRTTTLEPLAPGIMEALAAVFSTAAAAQAMADL
jgi:hypothetical protein